MKFSAPALLTLFSIWFVWGYARAIYTETSGVGWRRWSQTGFEDVLLAPSPTQTYQPSDHLSMAWLPGPRAHSYTSYITTASSNVALSGSLKFDFLFFDINWAFCNSGWHFNWQKILPKIQPKILLSKHLSMAFFVASLAQSYSNSIVQCWAMLS